MYTVWRCSSSSSKALSSVRGAGNQLREGAGHVCVGLRGWRACRRMLVTAPLVPAGTCTAGFRQAIPRIETDSENREGGGRDSRAVCVASELRNGRFALECRAMSERFVSLHSLRTNTEIPLVKDG